MITSGLRIGTPALATRGFGDEEFQEVADVIADLLLSKMSPNSAMDRVKTLTQAFKLY